MFRQDYRSCGFTLIEVLGVIVLIGMILAIAYPFFSQTLIAIDDTTKEADLERIKAAISQFYLDTKSYPQQLSDLWQENAELTGWQGPYLQPSSFGDRLRHYRIDNLGKVYRID